MGSKPEEKKSGKAKGDGLEMIDMEEIGKKKKRKRSTFDYVRYAIMTVASIVFVIAAYQLYSIYSEYSEGEQEYETVLDNFTSQEDPGGESSVSADGAAPAGFVKTNVDFAKMQQENPDVKAWIQFEAIGEINYPIVQHPSDNDFYLKKMWNKEENKAGSIFMDITNAPNFQDYHTFVYGHNMKNLSMFGRLKEYKDPAFYAGKEYFWVYTPEANYQYQIFSVHEEKVSSGYFKTFETMSDEYTAYILKSKEDSRYDTGVPVSGEDHTVTLSTCTASGDQWRLLVQGKLVNMEMKAGTAEGAGVAGEAAPEGQIPQEQVPAEQQVPAE